MTGLNPNPLSPRAEALSTEPNQRGQQRISHVPLKPIADDEGVLLKRLEPTLKLQMSPSLTRIHLILNFKARSGRFQKPTFTRVSPASHIIFSLPTEDLLLMTVLTGAPVATQRDRPGIRLE